MHKPIGIVIELKGALEYDNENAILCVHIRSVSLLRYCKSIKKSRLFECAHLFGSLLLLQAAAALSI